MLAITGLVRNPSGGRAVEKLNAVVFLFDQHALNHGNYIPRNFLLAYLIIVYAIVDGIRWRPRGST